MHVSQDSMWRRILKTFWISRWTKQSQNKMTRKVLKSKSAFRLAFLDLFLVLSLSVANRNGGGWWRDQYLSAVLSWTHGCSGSEVLFSFQKFSRFSITSNLAAHAWSIKYRRKQKLITQFTCKSRDESFDPS